MSGVGGTVLVVGPGNLYAMQAVEKDLSASGFDVVRVARPGALPDAASGRSVAAIVTPFPPRHGRRAAALRQVPVVVLAGPNHLRRIPWPAGALMRRVPTFDPRDLGRGGALAEAVRSAISAPAPAAATPFERFGAALWHLGSILIWVYLAAFLYAVSKILRGRAADANAWMSDALLLFFAGTLLVDFGGRVALGERPGISRWNWVSIAFLTIGVALKLWPR